MSGCLPPVPPALDDVNSAALAAARGGRGGAAARHCLLSSACSADTENALWVGSIAPVRLPSTARTASGRDGMPVSGSKYVGVACALSDGGSMGRGKDREAKFFSSCLIMLCCDTLVT